MTRTRWKSGVSVITVASLLFARAGAVGLTGCSTQNTGSGGKSSNSIYMSNGQCSDNCAGYAFAITQFQNCWCSNTAPGDTANTGSCNQNCPGYPNEQCGNAQQGLFGYVALGKAPTSTMGSGGGGGGGGGGNNGGGGGGQFAPPPPVIAPQPSTSVIISSQPPQTVVQTQYSTQLSTILPPPPSTTQQQTSVVTSIQQTTQLSISSAPPSTIVQDPSTSIVDGPTSTITPTPVVLTSALSTTVSGSVVTHYITSTPSVVPGYSQSQDVPRPTKTGLSNGAVAGATIGAIAGAALLAGLIFLLLWRRKKNQSNDTEGAGGGPPKRNASVLSRVGLLRSSQGDPTTGPTLPQITTTGLPHEDGPNSAATGGSSQMGELGRRNSRPLFSDNRLNPHALMTQPNMSRTSVSTLQDNQDYSRPLEVRNPDMPRTPRS